MTLNETERSSSEVVGTKVLRKCLTALVVSAAVVQVCAYASSILIEGRQQHEEVIPQDEDEAIGSVIYGIARRVLVNIKESNSDYDEIHRPLHPIETRDLYGFFFATLGLMVAAGGGIGGGGMLVPIYILVLGFSTKYAIPLSNVTVFGGAMANTILNWNKRHPLADRPLIDWDLILVMEPLTISGALMGAFINKLLSEKYLIICLVLLLSFTGFNTLKKARKMYKKESILIKELEANSNEKESELTKLARKEEHGNDEESEGSLLDNMESSEYGPMDEVIDDDLQKILDEERSMPFSKIKALVLMFIVVLFINLMKGGGSLPSPLGITCGSTSFWLSNIIILVWIGLVSVFARNVLVTQYHKKQEVNFKYVEGDIKWDERATVVYPFVCMFAGFFAGMFGIGGGIVKGPLMLEMGVHPAVSSACSACMILFTSFTATTSFIVFGLLVKEYAYICFSIGFLATIVGQLGLNHVMKLLGNRSSFIAFSIGAVVLLSAFLMTIQYIVSVAEGHESQPGGICGGSGASAH